MATKRAYAAMEGPAAGGLRNEVEQWRGWAPGTLERRVKIASVQFLPMSFLRKVTSQFANI